MNKVPLSSATALQREPMALPKIRKSGVPTTEPLTLSVWALEIQMHGRTPSSAKRLFAPALALQAAAELHTT